MRKPTIDWEMRLKRSYVVIVFFRHHTRRLKEFNLWVALHISSLEQFDSLTYLWEASPPKRESRILDLNNACLGFTVNCTAQLVLSCRSVQEQTQMIIK